MKFKKAAVALLAGVSLAGATYLPKQVDQVQAKTTKKKSSELFPKDPYPKVKYTNGKYGVETTASAKARLAWSRRHSEKWSMYYHADIRKTSDLNRFKKSRQKIVFQAVEALSKKKKVLFTVTDVQEGTYTEEYMHRYFSEDKIPGSWHNYRFWAMGPQLTPVNWKNKKGIMYEEVPYYTTKQLVKMSKAFSSKK